jgi:uncharacterized protein YfaS (alpha-2-macroglobulin family)
MKARMPIVIVVAALLFTPLVLSQDYRAADEGQRPAGSATVILPDKFLRGFDPVTVYFSSNQGPGKQTADEGPKILKIKPGWPGAWFWLDRKTLQFRPAEPWPALRRFAVAAKGKNRVLTTMMSAPAKMSPASGSNNLKPFRTFTLTFPQALPIRYLKKMINLEIAELPGLSSSARYRVKDWNIARLPRRSHRDAGVYAVTLDREVPEGRQLQVKISLALGDEGKVLWTGRLSVRPPFRLESVGCAGMHMPIHGDVKVPVEMALACGHHGETPRLVFTAPVSSLTLTALKKLVKLEPAVRDLGFQIHGRRVALKGKFSPDTIYRMTLGSSPIKDQDRRKLQDPGDVQVFFYLGRRQPFLRWGQARAILELRGPRMIPLSGYGEPRADVRIYRIDPLHEGLWPFPHSPIVIDEESPPPFPGEEPERKEEDLNYVTPHDLNRHLRLLGSPLVSKVVDLPLAKKSSTTNFGLDIGRLLDKAVGRRQPGHYLVGLRRLTGPPRRIYVRVQVTDLSLTSVEERDRVIFYVRSIDSAEPVSGAKIVIEAVDEPEKPLWGKKRRPPRMVAKMLKTDSKGRAVLSLQKHWRRIHRIHVHKGADALVLDPRDPPPRFAQNHWSPWGQWLHWITEESIPEPKNDRLLGFVFTERAIYRPGEKVYIKGYVRSRLLGQFKRPEGDYLLKIQGPGGKEWTRAVSFTPLYGFSTEFQEQDIPTGSYSVGLYRKKPYTEVARRHFKIEAYRIPTFEVQLVAPDKVPNDGPFTIKAVARYYAGGSVSGQPIEWRVTRRSYHHVPEGWEDYLFASSTQFSRGGRARPPESIHGAGELTINPALDMDGSARTYVIEATVTGVDNQQASALAFTRALPPFVLGMKLGRYLEKPTTIKPEILAIGVDDKPKEKQKVTVRLFRRTWHSHLRETDFATGKASYVTEQQDQKILEKVVYTGKKPVRPALKIKTSGVYVVELVARDKLGRVQTLSADLYVGGKEPMAWKKPRQGVFELSTDKKKYRPGDTAKLVVKSPFTKGKLLIILEEPRRNKYIYAEVEGGKAVYKIPIQPEYVPNLPVHVVLMRGRLGESVASDERYRPQTLASSLDIEIEPTGNKVYVGIQHPVTVQPGSTVPVTVTLQDDRKKPLSGEITLWLVDEAVLSLADEASLDPSDYLIQRNNRRTSIRDTRNRVVGRIQEEEEPAGDGDEEAKEDEARLPGKRRVRKTFMTVPFYQATLNVGRSGRITVPVKMSDDLTNFKVRVVAASGFSRMGYRQNRLRVRLPVLVQPQLPRFVRQGDRFWAGGVGRLVEGPEGAGAVAVRVLGLLKEKSWKKKIILKRTQAESHIFPVEARTQDPTVPTTLTVRMDIVRLKDKVGDAFEVKIPLLPDRTVEHFAYFEELKPGLVKLKAFPEEPRDGQATQEIVVSAVPGVLELLAGLDYLEGYPHGCLEQKLSRIMPQMAVGDLLRKLGLNDHYALQVGEHAKRLLDEIGVFQDDAGSFAFWPGASGSVQLTAQAVRCMHMCRKVGVDVPQKSWNRAVAALKRALRSDYRGLRPGYRYNQQTIAMRALVQVGELDEHYMIGLYHHRKDMDLTSLADLAASMTAMNRADPRLFSTNLAALKESLWENVIFKLYRGKPTYKGIRWRRADWYSDYLGSRASTLAAVFESLCYLDPQNRKLGILRDALLSCAHATGGFGSTHGSNRAIAALLVYLAHARHESTNAQVALSEDGVLKLSEKNKVAHARVRSAKRQTVTLKGAAKVGAHVKYTYLPKAPGDQVDTLNQGFVVSRSATVIHEDNSANTHFEDKQGDKVALKVGDILEIHTRLLSQKQLYHVALVVPFAAGLEPLNPELKTSGPEARPSRSDSIQPTYVQRLDNEVRYYFTRLPKGTHTFHFRVRAACEGSFVHPASYAEQMYHQEVRGRGAGMRIDVTGEHHSAAPHPRARQTTPPQP